MKKATILVLVAVLMMVTSVVTVTAYTQRWKRFGALCHEVDDRCVTGITEPYGDAWYYIEGDWLHLRVNAYRLTPDTVYLVSLVSDEDVLYLIGPWEDDLKTTRMGWMQWVNGRRQMKTYTYAYANWEYDVPIIEPMEGSNVRIEITELDNTPVLTSQSTITLPVLEEPEPEPEYDCSKLNDYILQWKLGQMSMNELLAIFEICL